MTDSNTDRLASIRARAEAATPGPWRISGHEVIGVVTKAFVQSIQHPWVADVDAVSEDAEFITAAREDIPFLLDQLATAEAKIAQVQAEAQAWADSPQGEIAPTQGVGTHFLKILSASPVSALDVVRVDAPQPFTCEWPDHDWRPLDDGSRDTSRCVRCGMRKH